MIEKKRIWLLAAAAALALSACAPVPRPGNASEGRAAYLKAHRELPPTIAEAIESGALMLGMNPQQVVAVLGQPLSRRAHGGTPPVEVWQARVHQSGRWHSGTLFRLVFVGGRLALIEPV